MTDAIATRRGGAFAALAGTSLASSTHVIGAVGHALGMLAAPSADGAIAAHVLGVIVGWCASAAILVATARRVDGTHAPTAGGIVLVAAVVLATTLASTVLGAVGAALSTHRYDAWASTTTQPIGDLVIRVSYASTALNLASSVVHVALLVAFLVWLVSREPARATPPETP